VGNLKLGKDAARIDYRTLRLTDAMKDVLPPIPTEWDFDQNFKVDTPMFLNDVLSCCVIAARGHQTKRFEAIEQRKVIDIPDQTIKDEYFTETGGCDGGLVLLDSLKKWRNDGWQIEDKCYTSYAFAALDRQDHQEVRTAIYLFAGIQIGVQLPQYAMDCFDDGFTWDVPRWYNFGGKKILGGHAIYIHGYDRGGLIGTSWGKNFKMTWGFWDRYTDEGFAIIDQRDKWIADSPVDVEKLEKYLRCL
jgi:hypothetical protein